MTITQLDEQLNALTDIMTAFERRLETAKDEEETDDAARIFKKAARLKRALLIYATDFDLDEEQDN